jgi:hypothetical protein
MNRVHLPNGIRAEMYAGKPRYPSDAMVDLHLRLYAPDGQVLTGRRDLEIMLVDPVLASKHEPFKSSYQEDSDHPGVYMTRVKVPADWTKVTALLPLSETGNPNAPGQVVLAQTMVDHAAPVSIGTPILARWHADELQISLPVMSTKAGLASVRATLSDGEAVSLDELKGSAQIKAGGSEILLHSTAIHASDPQARVLYLQDLTLYFDGVWSDLAVDPVPLGVPEPPT